MEALGRRACERLQAVSFPRSVIVALGTDEETGCARLELHAFDVFENRRSIESSLLRVAVSLTDQRDPYFLVFVHSPDVEEWVIDCVLRGIIARYEVLPPVRPPVQAREWLSPTSVEVASDRV